ncbi:MAG: hypothetical protein IJZ42_09865 [Lachnospiraceae bacterium]|nr:hypothetical protein [Lachnospiraceae bacterium]
MQKSKKLKYIIIAAIAILIAVVGVIILIVSNVDRTKIYDNVRVLSDESGQNELLVTVEADRLIFKENPGYVTGDVLVSGITENTPDGFIRKVVSVSQEGGQYVLETEPGLITDVFEEVHIEKTFILSDEGATEVESSGIGYSNSFNDIIISSVATATGITRSNDPLFDDDGDYVFNLEEEFDIANVLSVETEVGFGLQLDFKLEIEKGDVVLGLTLHNAVGGEIFLGLTEELKKEFEKELLSMELPSIQFVVGSVPVVITNEMFVKFEGEASISGKLGTTIELEAEKVVGFEYNSATNKVVEINEDNYLADGTKWSVGGSVKGEVEAGIFIHLASKLYDSTGIDLAFGIEGSTSAELASTVDTDGSYEDCVGRIDLEVGPELEGSIVVTVPIVDYELADLTIFETDLPAFWEEHWVSSENWEEELASLEDENVEMQEEVTEVDANEVMGDTSINNHDYQVVNSSANMQLDGKQIVLPIRVSELESMGFDLSLVENEKIEPKADSNILEDEILLYNNEIWMVLISNPSENAISIRDGIVMSIVTSAEMAPGTDACVLGEIGMGTEEEVVKAIYDVYSNPLNYIEEYDYGCAYYIWDENGGLYAIEINAEGKVSMIMATCGFSS